MCIKVEKTNLEYTREPLKTALGFKGKELTELWQITCTVFDSQGNNGVGLGVQSVLWSDERVFYQYGQQRGNELMLADTQYALDLLRGCCFSSPPQILAQIIPDVMKKAQELLALAQPRLTFILNALTPIDFALWQLYMKTHQGCSLTALAGQFTSALTQRHDKLGEVPLVSYNTSLHEIERLIANDTFLLKIKLGHAGADPAEMLAKDILRMTEIHDAVKNAISRYTISGHIMYYLDLNGRYESRKTLDKLFLQLDKIGALERTVLLEEPFAQDNPLSVADCPVRIAADESAHSVSDVIRLIEEYGYSAIALKPIAKTFSITLKMLEAAYQRGVVCFCADLTVNPLMREWNKWLAARIDKIPELKIAIVESNGKQNYQNWGKMLKSTACSEPVHSIYTMNQACFDTDESILPG